MVEGLVGQGDELAGPRLDGDGLKGGDDALVQGEDGDGGVGHVVPEGEHAALDLRVLLGEAYVSDDGGRPVVVESTAVEEVLVVARFGHYVDEAVGDGDKLVADASHGVGLGIAVVPSVHEHSLVAHGRLSFGMGERSPEHGLLAIALDEGEIVVGVGTELFHHLLLGVGIFVGADVDARPTEDGVRPRQVFGEEGVHEGVDIGIGEVEVVHAIVFGRERRAIVGEGEGVGGRVNLGDDLDAVGLGKLLQLDELVLGVAAVGGGEAGVGVALQSEGGVGLVPVVVEVFGPAVVVEMELEGVHLEEPHELDQLSQIGHGDVFASGVKEHSAQRILGRVDDGASRQGALEGQELQQRARGPEGSTRGRGGDGGLLGDADFVGFVVGGELGVEGEDDVAALRLAGGDVHLQSQKREAVVGEELCGGAQLFGLHDDATARKQMALGGSPRRDFGNDEGFAAEASHLVPFRGESAYS